MLHNMINVKKYDVKYVKVAMIIDDQNEEN